MGCDSGLASAGLMHAVWRSRLRQPAAHVLNIVQLVGWGTFELVVMRDATVLRPADPGLLAAAWCRWRPLRCCGGGVVAFSDQDGSMVRAGRADGGAWRCRWWCLSIWLSWQFCPWPRPGLQTESAAPRRGRHE